MKRGLENDKMGKEFELMSQNVTIGGKKWVELGYIHQFWVWAFS